MLLATRCGGSAPWKRCTVFESSRSRNRAATLGKKTAASSIYNLLFNKGWLAMAIGDTTYVDGVREQLLAGRTRLSDVLGHSQSEQMVRLLEEVDSALERIDQGNFGVCEVCLGTVEEDRLRENPLARVCLDCLTPKQMRALEYDLEL